MDFFLTVISVIAIGVIYYVIGLGIEVWFYRHKAKDRGYRKLTEKEKENEMACEESIPFFWPIFLLFLPIYFMNRYVARVKNRTNKGTE